MTAVLLQKHTLQKAIIQTESLCLGESSSSGRCGHPSQVKGRLDALPQVVAKYFVQLPKGSLGRVIEKAKDRWSNVEGYSNERTRILYKSKNW